MVRNGCSPPLPFRPMMPMAATLEIVDGAPSPSAHHPRHRDSWPIRYPFVRPPSRRGHPHKSRSCPDGPTPPSHHRRRGRIVHGNLGKVTASFAILFRRQWDHRRRSSRSCPVGRTSPLYRHRRQGIMRVIAIMGSDGSMDHKTTTTRNTVEQRRGCRIVQVRLGCYGSIRSTRIAISRMHDDGTRNDVRRNAHGEYIVRTLTFRT